MPMLNEKGKDAKILFIQTSTAVVVFLKITPKVLKDPSVYQMKISKTKAVRARLKM